MPQKKIQAFDLFKDLSSQLRERSTSIGLNKYVPMKAQSEFHAARKQGRIYSGGNRAGKTVAGAVESVKWLTGEHELYSKIFPPPVKGRIVAVDFDRGVDLVTMPEVRKWMPTEFLINGRWADSYHKATRLLTLTNGSTCEFMSYDQDVDKFAGTSRHFVWMDEEPPEAIFNECLARLIDTNGCWWLTLTPLIEFSWTADTLYEATKDGMLPNIQLWEVNMEDNVHIEKEAIESLFATLSEDEREARTKGTGYGESSLIYGEFNKYVIPELTEGQWKNIKENWAHFTMMDHGLRNPTAILFAAVGPEDEIVIYDEYYETGRLVHQNARAYMELVHEKGIEISYMVGDPSTQNTDPITGTSIRTEYGENGVWYMLGNNDVHAGILRVKSMLNKRRLHITANCRNLIKEGRKYKWAKPISNKIQARSNLLEKPVKKDDHALDALRYGIMSLPKTQEELDDDLQERLKLLIPAVGNSSIFEIADIGKTDGYIDEHLGLVE